MAPAEINHTTHDNKHKHVYMFETSDGVSEKKIKTVPLQSNYSKVIPHKKLVI